MTSLFAPFVTAILVLAAQAPADRTITGVVVDSQGKAAANAQVVLYAPPAEYGRTDPVEVSTKSDALGNFAIKAPQLGLGRSFSNWANILAHRPGTAVGAALVSGPPPYRLVLHTQQPRTIKIEGPGGEPVSGRGSLFEGSTCSAARSPKCPIRSPIRSRPPRARRGRRPSPTWLLGTSSWR